VKRSGAGQFLPVEETTSPGTDPAHGPEISCDVDGDVARLTVAGELTEAARRPLIRTTTDLLLEQHGLHRIELHLSGVGYMNSGGMAVLVQVQKLATPRAIEVVLVGPTPAVVRPLQLSGLWHRFVIEGVGVAGESGVGHGPGVAGS
jgi:stage II sporulation protein AA (anti-sigma F factor antagonist)